MKKTSNCTICKEPKSAYILSNKRVCMVCDELIFDIEIECDDEPNYTKVQTARTLALARAQVESAKK